MADQKYSFLFIVQGEGRGHITQCIALYDILLQAGHDVKEVIVGKNPARQLPSFIYDKIKCPITNVASPTFVMDQNSKGIKLLPSIIKNIQRVKKFKQSTNTIKQIIQKHKPHAVINFYDPLLSLLYFFTKPQHAIISIAHQNIFLHGQYKFPNGKYLERLGLKFYTQLNSLRADIKIALSLYPLPAQSIIVVQPPLLRAEVFEQSISTQNFILVYLVNVGYLNEIVAWQMTQENKIPIHIFCHKNKEKEIEQLDNNIFIHKINDRLFLNKMAQCMALATTAGFESVAESLYLGKPSMLVPIAGHYEQHCNAHDGEVAGCSVSHHSFELDKLITFAQKEYKAQTERQDWIKMQSEMLELIEKTIKKKNNG